MTTKTRQSALTEFAHLIREDGRIELAEFITALARLAHDTGDDVDLVTAGILTRRAWTTLAASTSAIADRLEAETLPPMPDSPGDPWAAFLNTDWAREGSPDREFTRALLNPSTRAPLAESQFRRPLGRRVTLDELADALAEARREAEIAIAARNQRSAARADRAQGARAVILEEDLGGDIADLRARLPPHPRPLRDLRAPLSRLGLVTDLVAALHLAARGEAAINQEAPAVGPVLVSARPLRRSLPLSRIMPSPD